ncbi:uncharacterized protein RSE6_09414 [Rhynchosporium secalis]|uniref:Uncharacterized protein n=1 Tax=Rhynchosporium secalis TaxID=38038 RepID=A0A1E1MHY9_RHYSE|nr:uncharacterized protein RSE6_09414 [Rhynchosporium secalis]
MKRGRRLRYGLSKILKKLEMPERLLDSWYRSELLGLGVGLEIGSRENAHLVAYDCSSILSSLTFFKAKESPQAVGSAKLETADALQLL